MIDSMGAASIWFVPHTSPCSPSASPGDVAIGKSEACCEHLQFDTVCNRPVLQH